MQRPGIEPGPPAWQARILPLNQRCLARIPQIKYSEELNKLSSTESVMIDLYSTSKEPFRAFM